VPLGIGFENKLSNNITLLFDAGAVFSYLTTEIGDKWYDEFKLVPYFLIEPRYYVNLKERKELGKRTDHYSGAYGAFKLLAAINISDNEWGFQFGPLVGFQRTLGSRGYWNIGIGVGSTIFKEDIKFGLIGEFRLGFILN
jgi:hypothetical protein